MTRDDIRDVANVICMLLRFLGVGLAILMILGSPFAVASSFWMGWPDAQLFISRWHNALLLFGWFLVPYSRIRPRLLWGLFFVVLLVASMILVGSAVLIYRFYSGLYVEPAWSPAQRQETLFLISLSLFACACQPLAVCAVRYFGLSFLVPNKSVQPTAGRSAATGG